MKEHNISIIRNQHWKTTEIPFFTVLTPVYNRRNLLKRVMESVSKQSFRDFEYIIVNDGSTENLDQIVNDYMDMVDFPVMYIKKPNGGVHTARNAGIREARGFLTVMIDSDDELIECALETFFNNWNSIPEQDRDNFCLVSARCKTEKGIEGQIFPANINSLPVKKAAIRYEKITTEIFHADRTDILKNNPWPEPEGITFVMESIIWFKLIRNYRILCINDILRIYHTEGEDHVFVYGKAKSTQYIKNMVWSFAFFLNNWKERKTHLRNYVDMLIKYCVLEKVLKKREGHLRDDMKLTQLRERVLASFLFLPSSVFAFFYNNRA